MLKGRVRKLDRHDHLGSWGGLSTRKLGDGLVEAAGGVYSRVGGAWRFGLGRFFGWWLLLLRLTCIDRIHCG